MHGDGPRAVALLSLLGIPLRSGKAEDGVGLLEHALSPKTRDSRRIHNSHRGRPPGTTRSRWGACRKVSRFWRDSRARSTSSTFSPGKSEVLRLRFPV